LNTVQKNIKKYRENKGITQEQMAEALNVTRQAISNWETGRTEPDIDTLQRLSDYLGITIEELIYGEKQSNITNVTNVHKNFQFGAKEGIGFGSVVAIVISYVKWHSIAWAILHGIFSWFYVIYFIIKYGWNG